MIPLLLLTCKKALIKLARRTAILASFSNCSLAPELTSPRRIRSCGWKLPGKMYINLKTQAHLFKFYTLFTCSIIDAMNVLQGLINVYILRMQRSRTGGEVTIFGMHVQILFTYVIGRLFPLYGQLLNPCKGNIKQLEITLQISPILQPILRQSYSL